MVDFSKLKITGGTVDPDAARRAKYSVEGGYEPRSGDINELPNYEKLTRSEKWIMGKLPGIADTGFGKVLADFNEGWAGKALQKLDILAEGAERTFGLGAQYLDALGDDEKLNELKTNLSAAWQAGSLTSDFARIPEIRIDDDGVKFSVPDDLPGMEGILTARRRIINGESLEDVRGSMMDDLGALAIRSQIQDVFQHIVGDPLFIVGKYVKPIEFLNTKIIKAATTKSLPSDLARITGDFEDLTKLAKQADNLKDLAKLEKIASKADDIEKLEAIAKLRNIIDDLPENITLTEKLAELTQNIETFEKMSWAEQKLLQYSGNLKGLDTPFDELKGFQKALRRYNPLSLTSQARASELFTNIINHFSVYALAKSDDPLEFMRILRRASDGTIGGDLGHMVATPTGRIFQGLMKKSISDGESLLRTWEKLGEFERPLLEMLTGVLGDSAPKIFHQLKNGEGQQIYSRLAEAMTEEQRLGIEDILKINGKAGLSAEVLESITKSLGDGVDLFDVDFFKGTVLNSMIDNLSKQAVIQYGVKQQGFVKQIADTVKAAESLAYLRLNPAYPIKNLVNNVATSIADGNFGVVSINEVEKFYDTLGFIPARAEEAFTAAGLAQQTVEGVRKASSAAAEALQRGQQSIYEIVRGERGWLGKVADKIRDFSVSDLVGAEKKWDFGIWAQEIERGASKRSLYLGYTKFWGKYAKTGVGLSSVADYDKALAGVLGTDQSKIIETVLEGVMNEKDLISKVFESDNLALNMPNIVRGAEKKLGVELGDILGDDFLFSIQDNIVAAAKKGETALNDVMLQTSNKMEKHISEMVDRAVEVMVDQAASRAKTEGPGAFTGLWSDLSDSTYATSSRHAIETNSIVADIKKGTDPAIADIAWRKYFQDADNYWGRFWDKQEKIVNKVSKVYGGNQGRRVVSNFKEIRKEWKGFYNTRKRLWNNYSDAKIAGKTPKKTYRAILDELDTKYTNAIATEDRIAREIDDLLTEALPENQRLLFKHTRDQIADMRLSDREYVAGFRKSLDGLSPSEIEDAYQVFWKQRMKNYSDLWQEEQKALAAVEGSRKAQSTYKLKTQEEAFQAGEALDDVSDTARAVEGVVDTARVAEEVPEGISKVHIPDFHSIVKRELSAGSAYDELYYNRGIPALNALKESALEIARDKPLKFVDLAPEAQKGVKNYVSHVQGQMSDLRLGALKYAEYTRDSALLNYSRTTNMDNWLQTIVPYEFWTMHTAWNWALRTVDRTHAVANILRLKKFTDTGFRPESGFPQRLKGHLRIKTPFLPKIFGDWIGDELFVNPMGVAIPIDNFTRPYEEYLGQERRDEGAAERVLEELLGDGQITQDEYTEAINAHAGAAWERAVGLARQDDTEGRMNAFDLGSMLLSPHAPIMWAYNESQGKQVQEGAFTPLGRSLRGIAGLFGVDTNDMPVLGIGGKIRQSIGLAPFSEWDDYRIDRMMVNMLSDKEVIDGIPVTIDALQRATIERAGPLYEEAKRRSLIESGINSLGSITGIPTKSYPPGEENVRKQKELYEKMYEKYEAGDHQAYGRFIEKYPEYEARIGLFKTPEERTRLFVVDQMWDTYNGLTSLDKREVRERLGDDFVNAFLNNETRSTDSLPVEMLSSWLTMMGGDPPGSLGDDAVPINFAPPEIGQVAQFFYDYRSQSFPDYFEKQNLYYKMDKGGARKTYLRQNPDLKAYWDWKWDFLERNPSVAPYLSENPPTYASPQALQEAFGAEPNVTPQELIASLGEPTFNQIVDFIIDGDPLDTFVTNKLDAITAQTGIEEDAIINQVASSIGR